MQSENFKSYNIHICPKKRFNELSGRGDSEVAGGTGANGASSFEEHGAAPGDDHQAKSARNWECPEANGKRNGWGIFPTQPQAFTNCDPPSYFWGFFNPFVI